jgi:hypothetical protein
MERSPYNYLHTMGPRDSRSTVVWGLQQGKRFGGIRVHQDGLHSHDVLIGKFDNRFAHFGCLYGCANRGGSPTINNNIRIKDFSASI